MTLSPTEQVLYFLTEAVRVGVRHQSEVGLKALIQRFRACLSAGAQEMFFGNSPLHSTFGLSPQHTVVRKRYIAEKVYPLLKRTEELSFGGGASSKAFRGGSARSRAVAVEDPPFDPKEAQDRRHTSDRT